jgi:hypothetical protein
MRGILTDINVGAQRDALLSIHGSMTSVAQDESTSPDRPARAILAQRPRRGRG